MPKSKKNRKTHNKKKTTFTGQGTFAELNVQHSWADLSRQRGPLAGRQPGAGVRAVARLKQPMKKG